MNTSEITIAQPTGLLRVSGWAVAASSNLYILGEMANITSASNRKVDVIVSEIVKAPPPESKLFASLGPLARIRYLAKNNRSELVFSTLSFVGGIYMIWTSIYHLSPALLNLLSWAAQAQGISASVLASTRDSFDWYIGGLMGIALLTSLGITMCAQKESKISFGKDTSKMILGFVVGFLSGTRPR